MLATMNNIVLAPAARYAVRIARRTLASVLILLALASCGRGATQATLVRGERGPDASLQLDADHQQSPTDVPPATAVPETTTTAVPQTTTTTPAPTAPAATTTTAPAATVPARRPVSRPVEPDPTSTTTTSPAPPTTTLTAQPRSRSPTPSPASS